MYILHAVFLPLCSDCPDEVTAIGPFSVNELSAIDEVVMKLRREMEHMPLPFQLLECNRLSNRRVYLTACRLGNSQFHS